MGLTTGKVVEVLFDNAKETYEKQDQLLDLVTFEGPDAVDMQNAGNIVWRPVQQHAPIIDGWDLTGEETGIIEETYPAILETPTNDLISQRADNMRNMRFWERRGEESGRRQASELNKRIAARIALQGSLFYRTDATSGWDVITEAQVMLNERQLYQSQRYFVMNDRDMKTFGSDLASRQTVQGRPEEVWRRGQITQNTAEFDVFTGSYLPNITGGADPATTVTGNQSFAPEAGSVDTATGIVTNVDYRKADIAVADSSGYNVGDKVSIANSGTTIKALGLADKIDTGQAMTFTIVAKPDSTTITVYPKPIAADDPALSTLEAAYANIDTRILNGATVNRLNIDASAKTNIFWDRSAVEVIGGEIPAKMFEQFAGSKVVQSTLANGLEMYMLYDGDITTMDFRYRLFVWYGITIAMPHICGVCVTY